MSRRIPKCISGGISEVSPWETHEEISTRNPAKILVRIRGESLEEFCERIPLWRNRLNIFLKNFWRNSVKKTHGGEKIMNIFPMDKNPWHKF